jgi:hypothetical protein
MEKGFWALTPSPSDYHIVLHRKSKGPSSYGTSSSPSVCGARVGRRRTRLTSQRAHCRVIDFDMSIHFSIVEISS